MKRKPFHFKQFDIYHDKCSMKVGTDGVLLGAWADIIDRKRILDVGTGSGLIAIMLAQRTTEDFVIDAVEIEENAFEQAKENIGNCKWHSRIQAHRASIQEYSKKCTYKYDLIISNPPFFLSGTKSEDQDRNNARHTDSLTQDDLLIAVKQLLSPTGSFTLILPIKEGDTFIKKAEMNGLICNRITKVKPKFNKPFERLLLEFSYSKQECKRDELVIQYIERNHYTPEYTALTENFYAIM